MDKDITKKYTNGEITIIWKPASCIHSKICWSAATGLPQVFDPRIKPWIKMENAPTDKIIEHVSKCPSGALSFYYNDAAEENDKITTNTIVETIKNGPLMVYGNITVKDNEGNETRKSKVTAFCRCGQSHNKPYCDGTHVEAKFSG
jgi:uncharacterized Fe-S cluster protein YjdI